MTFDDLKDLGSVEVQNMGGRTYYFLGGYSTMNEAEAVKKKVIERGTKDAYITFYYNNKIVNIQDVISLLQ
ncbi:MAG TPA: hypothetical protein VFZ52_09195 [Chryseolinea sp.]